MSAEMAPTAQGTQTGQAADGSLAVDLTYLEGSGRVDGHVCLLPHVSPVPTERPDLRVNGSLVPHTNQQVQGACKRESRCWHAGADRQPCLLGWPLVQLWGSAVCPSQPRDSLQSSSGQLWRESAFSWVDSQVLLTMFYPSGLSMVGHRLR